MEIKWIPTQKMRCDTLTKPKHDQVFCEFHGYLMNVPADHDDKAERLLTHTDLLPSVDVDPTLS